MGHANRFLKYEFQIIGKSQNGNKHLRMSFPFNEGVGDTTEDQVTGRKFYISNIHNDPVWKPGIKGTSLRLDGYSTWIQDTLSNQGITNHHIGISLWTAIQAAPVSDGDLIYYKDLSGNGFEVGMSKLGHLYTIVSMDGKSDTCYAKLRLPSYKWEHISVDIGEKIVMYLNGEVIGEIKHSFCPNIRGKEVLVIGKNPHTPYLRHLFPTGVINGLIDNLRIYDDTLSKRERVMNSKQQVSKPDFSVPPSQYSKEPQRPAFHAMPPDHWTNEPNGLVYSDGWYHLFYQNNPNGPYWSQIHWGHMKSRDLVHWVQMPIALAPGKSYDSYGIWSGDAVVENSKPIIIYTGVDGKKATVDIATSDSTWKNWTKYAKNPVIKSRPGGFRDFRDPHVWRDGDTWYMIIGTGLNSGRAAVLLYKSMDFRHWKYVKPFFVSKNPKVTGKFWEMPVFVRIHKNKYLLIVNTLPHPAKCYYWIGTFKNNSFVPKSGPHLYNIINHLLSPDVIRDPKHKGLVAIGIIPDKRSANDQYKSGWANVYSLPTRLRLGRDDLLRMTPVKALKSLRKDSPIIRNGILKPGSKNILDTVSGDQLEMKLHIVPQKAGLIRLTLRKSENDSERTDISLNFKKNQLVLDRTHSSLSTERNKGINKANVPLSSYKSINLHVFIDHSVIEVYINHRYAFATRVYPINPSKRVALSINKGLARVEIKAWKMKSIWKP